MKPKNYLRIVIFILGFLVLNQFIGRWFVNWSRYDSEYATAHREFVSMEDQVWLVFLGDSHTQKGAKAGDIPGAYNLASSSESYPFTYYIMKYYLEEKDFQPDIAVLEIDPHSFMSTRMNEVQWRDPAFWSIYVNYLEIDRNTEPFADLLPTIFKAKFSLLGSWSVTLEKLWPVEFLEAEPLEFGFVPLEEDMSDQTPRRFERNGLQRALGHYSEGEYPDETLEYYFLRLIDLLQAHDVDVVLVWYPAIEPYYAAMEQYVSSEAHISVVEDMLGDRQVDLILDYHDLFFGQPEYFADPDHLNVWGAEIFTQTLIEDLAKDGFALVLQGTLRTKHYQLPLMDSCCTQKFVIQVEQLAN